LRTKNLFPFFPFFAAIQDFAIAHVSSAGYIVRQIHSGVYIRAQAWFLAPFAQRTEIARFRVLPDLCHPDYSENFPYDNDAPQVSHHENY
jgi:hypothetical protein